MSLIETRTGLAPAAIHSRQRRCDVLLVHNPGSHRAVVGRPGVPDAGRPLFDESGVFARVVRGGDLRDRDRPAPRRRLERAERGRPLEDPRKQPAGLLCARSSLEQEAQANQVEAERSERSCRALGCCAP